MMASDEDFWEIAQNSGLDSAFVELQAFLLSEHQDRWAKFVQDGDESEEEMEGVSLEDIASVLQSINESGSWLSHYMMNSLGAEKSLVPAKLYSTLAAMQSLAREVVAQLIPCECPTCAKPKAE